MKNFDNSPASNTTALADDTALMASKKKLSRNLVVSIVLLTALLGTSSFIYWNKIVTREKFMQKERLFVEAISRRDSLQSLLNTASMRYDMLKSSIVKKDEALANQEKEISKIRALIETMLVVVNASEAQHSEISRLIKSLNIDIEHYKHQVETLKGENQQLVDDFNAEKEERNKTAKTVEIAKTAEAENTKTEVGSTLLATNFENVGVITGKNGKEKLTLAARKAEKLRVTFDLAENRNSVSGPKEIYVSITAPDGTPVAIASPGSNKVAEKDGKANLKMQKIVANYVKGEHQKVSFELVQDEKFVAGVYKIEVFNNGFKIGEGFKALKKCGVFD